MSRTYKDKPFKYSGRLKKMGKKQVKWEAKHKRSKLKRLTSSPPLGYIKKLLSDIWNWD